MLGGGRVVETVVENLTSGEGFILDRGFVGIALLNGFGGKLKFGGVGCWGKEGRVADLLPVE